MGSAEPQRCPSSGFRCPGYDHDNVNLVKGSLPIEVVQGRRRHLRNVTRHTSTLRLRLAIPLDELDQQQSELEERLSHLMGHLVKLQLVAGSVIVNMIAEHNHTSSLEAYRALVSTMTDELLSGGLQMDASILSGLIVQTRVDQVPVDVDCHVGFYCSAAAAYPCVRAPHHLNRMCLVSSCVFFTLK